MMPPRQVLIVSAVLTSSHQFDLSPRLKPGGFPVSRRGFPEGTWVRVYRSVAPAMRGSLQARTASPADRMFFAALTSRSWTMPQAGQVQERTSRPFLPMFAPHAWQTWLDGYQRSMTVSSRPYQAALYSSIRRKRHQPASMMLRFRPLFAACPLGRWIGNGVLDRFLEDESLFGEFLRTPVSEGGVESLVVGPPHIVVEVGA